METIVIDIQARYQDKTQQVNQSTAAMDRFSASITRMQNQATQSETRLNKIWNTAKNIGKTAITLPIKVLDYATRPLRSIFNLATSLKGVLLGVYASKAVNTFLKQPMQLADQIESAKIFFENKLGSTAASNKMLADIYKFDEKSPFNTMQIVGVAQSMMAMGFAADGLLDKLGIIGDVSASLGKGTEGVEGISRALGEMKMKGSLSGQEFLQLTSWGVAGKDYVKRAFGKDYESVNKLIKSGKMTIDQAIDGMLAEMNKDYGGAAASQSDRTITGIFGQVESLVQSKVFLKWGEGLAKGAKQGLGVFKTLLEKNQAGIERFGLKLAGLGEQISTWVAGKAEKSLQSLLKLMEDDRFKNATFFEKIGIAWDELIAQPFNTWWDSEGRSWAAGASEKIGKGMGTFFKDGLLFLLGFDSSNLDGAVEDGVSVGRSFAEGFLKGFDADTVWTAVKESAKGILGSAEKVLPGGEAPTGGSWMSALLLFMIGKKLGGGKLIGSLFGAGGTSAATGAAGAVGSAAVGGAAAATGGAFLNPTAWTSGFGSALKGGALRLGLAALNIWAADNKAEATVSEGVALGMSIGGGKLGAVIGTAVAGPVGTAVGGAVGSLIGWLAGKGVGNAIYDGYRYYQDNPSQKTPGGSAHNANWMTPKSYAAWKSKTKTDEMIPQAGRAFARGTSFAPRGRAWVGENGPEIVDFRGGERVYDARQSAQMASGSEINLGGIHFHVAGGGNAQSVIDAIRAEMPEIANELCEYLYRQLSRAHSNMPA